MNNAMYPNARLVAARAEAHFARHIALARARGRADVADPPDAATIEAIIDAAFWASLRREEGLTPEDLARDRLRPTGPGSRCASSGRCR